MRKWFYAMNPKTLEDIHWISHTCPLGNKQEINIWHPVDVHMDIHWSLVMYPIPGQYCKVGKVNKINFFVVKITFLVVIRYSYWL